MAVNDVTRTQELVAEPEPEVQRLDENGLLYKVVDGVVQTPWFSRKCLKQFQEEFSLRDGDVVVCTWPKCGTTWMQQIVLTLLYGGDKSKVKDAMVQAPWLEWAASWKEKGVHNDVCGEPMSVKELNEWDGSSRYGEGPVGRRVWKTHATADQCPWIGGPGAFGDKKKCIIVGRNPMDACCSMFHHCRDTPTFDYHGDLTHFINKVMLPGFTEGGTFWKYYADWEKAFEEHEGIMWITFEELKADPVASVRRVAEFIGAPSDDETVKNVVGASAFDAMKAKYQEAALQREQEGRRVKPNHIRQGKSGSWRKEIQGENLRAMQEAHERETKSTGLKFDWDFGAEPEAEVEASKEGANNSKVVAPTDNSTTFARVGA